MELWGDPDQGGSARHYKTEQKELARNQKGKTVERKKILGTFFDHQLVENRIKNSSNNRSTQQH
jgi:hypothetical protein